jgi:hypothetical protein
VSTVHITVIAIILQLLLLLLSITFTVLYAVSFIIAESLPSYTVSSNFTIVVLKVVNLFLSVLSDTETFGTYCKVCRIIAVAKKFWNYWHFLC